MRNLWGRCRMRRENRINATLKKWFEQTRERLDALPNRETEIDGFCTAALHTIMIYLNASRILQDGGLNLPAMALVRIASDVVIKLIWCLQDCSEAEIDRRIGRWRKKTVAEQKRLLNDLKDVFLTREQVERLISTVEKTVNPQLKEMPSTRQLFRDVMPLFSGDIYCTAYLQFNSAVHVDTELMTKILMSPLRPMGCDRDISLQEEDTENLRTIRLSLLYMALVLMYRRYSWDLVTLTDEYHQILGCQSKPHGSGEVTERKAADEA